MRGFILKCGAMSLGGFFIVLKLIPVASRGHAADARRGWTERRQRRHGGQGRPRWVGAARWAGPTEVGKGGAATVGGGDGRRRAILLFSEQVSCVMSGNGG
ncbi:hypothetical protein SETIT_4G005700v2 [Setaria italica]|uniref:Uncharacterized protein n=1 Tax=Setaria italica TaxID=4555 RepID=A0A368QRB9_SETIT|nr:hypothetical protein SETIT_4G005700v2 [Setaria italica]